MRYLLLVLLLVACREKDQSGMPAAILGEVRIDGEPRQVKTFKFLESQGRAIGSAELDGKVWVGSFIYSRCATHCVRICSVASKLQAEFGKNNDFRIVCTTVDPAYDTAPVLKKFAKSWNASPDTWYFLTGDRGEIQRFSYNMGIAGDPEEMLNHNKYFVVVGRKGRARGYFDSTDNERTNALRKLVRQLLDEK